jgi:hypothetical protein
MATTLQRTQQVLPEYQERFLKDLLANVYQTDPETGAVSGIAATSPLYGQAQYDEQGNLLYRTPEGGTTTDPTMAARNQQGQPMELVVGGVPRADIMQFTPAQQRAAELMTGRFNPETGQYEGGGIGLYQPMMEQAEQTFTTGLGSYLTGAGELMGTTGAFDPTSYRQFYDPFVEDVIRGTEADLQRQADVERQRIGRRQLGRPALLVAPVRLLPNKSCSAMLRSRWPTPRRVCVRRHLPARNSKRNQPLRTRWLADRLLSTDFRSAGSGYRPVGHQPSCVGRSRAGCSFSRRQRIVQCRCAAASAATGRVRRAAGLCDRRGVRALPAVQLHVRHLPRCAVHAANAHVC